MQEIIRRLNHAAAFVLVCFAAVGVPAQGQTGDATISAPYTREMSLPGKMGGFTILNPGRIARPVCARKLSELMQSGGGSARLPDEVYDLYGKARVSRNPNRLNFETVHYTFSTRGGVVVTMSCNIDSTKSVTFSVEGYARGNAILDDVRPVVDGHFRYFGNQLSFHD